ncbi:Acyl dehydratase [Streptomyces sp. BpilaLS-43]|uniref:MaoC/PaaZ C-terminal domain-containing protein n=1 Tax=Streptomyces sp. BpilaLS-43 TaxID=1839778 RepID=UPI00081B5715|nr:MaoC/PaaZ C-terminal domain-containing protein [Streptomyces sp. BpilaLS-43]SCD91084.1 Acyl dehydratase [Streptomyces sp. BpilaLS-43]
MAALGTTLLRGAVTSPFKRAGRPGASLPATREVRPAAPAAPGHLATYRSVCGFTGADSLPLTYPHVLGFPLALRIMTGRAFPLPVLGLVHTWIEITRHRPLRPTDPLELRVRAVELTPHRRGTEVTMATEARLAGETVWESRSGYLSRHPTDTSAATGPPAPPAPRELPAVAEWRLPSDLGRRYSAASGDRNPIHLHPLTARLFGFPRHIAHGMWTVARCLAEAENGPASGPGRGGRDDILSVRADFKAPVLLPATVTYAAAGSDFQVRGESRVHLTGSVVRDG